MERYRELAGLIDRFSGRDGVHATAIPRVGLIRSTKPTEPLHALHQPALCILAQGRKQVMLGDQVVYTYDKSCYLVVSVDVPVVGQVTEASAAEPYLCFRLDFDPAQIGALLMELELDRGRDEAPGSGITLGTMTPELLDAVIRLLKLLETPRDIAALAPLAEREILYRLLLGDAAAKLRQIALADSKLQQINRAITWIKRHYAEPFSINALTRAAGMSPSSLHHHFKAVTAMSPLQYQKQLRLQEARRLILSQAMDAATAGFMVGYESPSQFSREYSRMFGAPPVRDITRLRQLQEFGLDQPAA